MNAKSCWQYLLSRIYNFCKKNKRTARNWPFFYDWNRDRLYYQFFLIGYRKGGRVRIFPIYCLHNWTLFEKFFFQFSEFSYEFDYPENTFLCIALTIPSLTMKGKSYLSQFYNQKNFTQRKKILTKVFSRQYSGSFNAHEFKTEQFLKISRKKLEYFFKVEFDTSRLDVTNEMASILFILQSNCKAKIILHPSMQKFFIIWGLCKLIYFISRRRSVLNGGQKITNKGSEESK